MIDSIEEYNERIKRLREYNDFSLLTDEQYDLVRSLFDYIDMHIPPIQRNDERNRIGQFLTDRGWNTGSWLIYNTHA